MSESKREELIKNFRDKEYRESYAEDYLNTTIATQLRVIREQRGVAQAQLAQAVGTKQTAISRIENVNNTARNIGTLEAIAFRLGCRLKVSFETFGSLIDESLYFSRENLQRPSFEEDPVLLGMVPAVVPVGDTNAYMGAANAFGTSGPSFGVSVQGYPNTGVMFAASDLVPLFDATRSLYSVAQYCSGSMYGNIVNAPVPKREDTSNPLNSYSLAA